MDQQHVGDPPRSDVGGPRGRWLLFARAAWLAVVRETMQPAHASLWLRPTAGPVREETGEQKR